MAFPPAASISLAAREGTRDLPADAARGAGDEGNLVLQTHDELLLLSGQMVVD
jgi:hypothetical protein